jgi:hypothetical protein
VTERIVAFALLTKPEVETLGANFRRVWPIEDSTCFNGLVDAIDDADRRFRDRATSAPIGSDPAGFPQPR